MTEVLQHWFTSTSLLIIVKATAEQRRHRPLSLINGDEAQINAAARTDDSYGNKEEAVLSTGKDCRCLNLSSSKKEKKTVLKSLSYT